MKYHKPNHILFYFTLNLLVGFPLLLSGQNTEEQISRVQRSIFIYNLAEQVVWANEQDFNTFTIGVLGPDRTIIDLQSMSQKRKIKNKPVTVKRFNKVKDIGDIRVLYVNKNYNFDISYILKSIADKNILLISENYNYNTSMINIVPVGASFEYEINEGLLITENFTLKPSLKKYAITSIIKWKQLYKETEKNLEEEKEIVKEKTNQIYLQDTLIEKQKDEIAENEKKLTDKEKVLSQKRDSLQSLWSFTKIQTQKFEDKVAIEKELAALIEKQMVYAKEQEEEINARKQFIQKQIAIVDSQKNEIQLQKGEIDAQLAIIEKEKKINILLFGLAGILLLSGLLLFRSYRKKKKLVQELEEKNKTIKKQTETLEQKNQEIEQFAYIASHDLQEPLNTIGNLIGILQEDYKDALDETATQSLAFMHDSSIRMRSLIKGLLKHSKLGIIDTLKNVDCNILITQVQQDLAKRIQETNTSIELHDLPSLKASEIQLRLVFQNLISNAIKFSKKDKTPIISISAELVEKDFDRKMWQFSVEDNGIGIAVEHLDRIFAIFQRLHAREAYEGTGIGLAHTKKIVNAHGGTIWVTSKLGIGSIFYFTIPI